MGQPSIAVKKANAHTCVHNFFISMPARLSSILLAVNAFEAFEQSGDIAFPDRIGTLNVPFWQC